MEGTEPHQRLALEDRRNRSFRDILLLITFYLSDRRTKDRGHLDGHRGRFPYKKINRRRQGYIYFESSPFIGADLQRAEQSSLGRARVSGTVHSVRPAHWLSELSRRCSG